VENYQNIPGYFKTICVKVANAWVIIQTDGKL
jgi:hypothetical protein